MREETLECQREHDFPSVFDAGNSVTDMEGKDVQGLESGCEGAWFQALAAFDETNDLAVGDRRARKTGSEDVQE